MLTILFLSFLITILQLFSSEDSLVLSNHKHTFIATFIYEHAIKVLYRLSIVSNVRALSRYAAIIFIKK